MSCVNVELWVSGAAGFFWGDSSNGLNNEGFLVVVVTTAGGVDVVPSVCWFGLVIGSTFGS